MYALEAHHMVVDPEVQEIVGPPLPYFETAGANGALIRIAYRTIILKRKTDLEVIALYHKTMDELRTALKQSGGMNPKVWWRTRPEVQRALNREVHLTFRLETSPPLSDKEWNRIFGVGNAVTSA
jgi:hypothetical protein